MRYHFFNDIIYMHVTVRYVMIIIIIIAEASKFIIIDNHNYRNHKLTIQCNYTAIKKQQV